MSEIKWIKITTDIFDDEKISLIDGLPDRDAIIVIWFKILTLAGKLNRNGVLAISKNIVYTDEMLAQTFHRPLNTVRMALEIFEKFGMVEKIDGVITLPNWEKHQNIDGMEKIKEQNRNRVARHRKKQKLLAQNNECNVTCNVTCNGDVTVCNALEEEEDKDKEYSSSNSNSFEKIINSFEIEFQKTMSPTEINAIRKIVEQYGEELTLGALTEALLQGKANLNYITGILRNWSNGNVTTMEQARQTAKQYRDRNRVSSKKKVVVEEKKEWGF